MIAEWDVPVPMDDGLPLRADVFRPDGRRPPSGDPHLRPVRQGPGVPGRLPGPVADHGQASIPTCSPGSTNRYQNWEVVDPEKWVPDGYACVRVDSRGAGPSPGLPGPILPAGDPRPYECIEWAARQPWSNGKVGLRGISYYAMNQWQVAALQPPHLAAICAVGGRGGLLPRRRPTTAASCPRLLGELVPACRSPRSSTGVGETGRAAGSPASRSPAPETLTTRAGREPRRLRRRSARPPAGRRVLPRPRRRTWPRSPCRCSRRPTGAARACTPAATSRAISGPRRPQKWLEVHGLEHWTDSTPTTASACRSGSSAVS